MQSEEWVMPVSQLRKFAALGVVLTLSLLLGVQMRRQSRESGPDSVYLVKSGTSYLVAWVEEESNQVRTRRFGVASQARDYLEKDLGLRLACEWRPELKLEKLFTIKATANSQLKWKTTSNPFINRLTFEKGSELKMFYEAFLQGAYSPSPFGHSILFLSKKSSQKHCRS